jgi:hypothetical protein
MRHLYSFVDRFTTRRGALRKWEITRRGDRLIFKTYNMQWPQLHALDLKTLELHTTKLTYHEGAIVKEGSLEPVAPVDEPDPYTGDNYPDPTPSIYSDDEVTVQLTSPVLLSTKFSRKWVHGVRVYVDSKTADALGAKAVSLESEALKTEHRYTAAWARERADHFEKIAAAEEEKIRAL